MVAVCLEQVRGPLVYALLKYDFLTLYPINPKTLAKFCEAFTTSRANDDPGDATYLAHLLTLHRDKLKPWLPGDENTRTLQYLIEHSRRLDDRSRISNRLTSLLKGYFLQVLNWFPDICTKLVADFLLRWPSLGSLMRVHDTNPQAVLPRTPLDAPASSRPQDRAHPVERPARDRPGGDRRR